MITKEAKSTTDEITRADCSSKSRRERARARATWPVVRFALGTEPSDDLSSTTTAEQRLAMMWPLSLGAWELANGPWTKLPRHEWPGRTLMDKETVGAPRETGSPDPSKPSE